MIVLLLCTGGLIAAFILHSLLRLIFWMKEFIYILFGAVLIMIMQLSVILPAVVSPVTADKLYYSMILLSGLIIAWGYLSFFGIWREEHPSRFLKGLITGWSLLTGLTILLKWLGWDPSFYLALNPLTTILPSAVIIFRYKELKHKEFGNYLVIFSLLSISGYSFEIVEYFIIKNGNSAVLSLPTGFFSFTGFSLILALFALFFSLKTIYELKGQLSSNVPSEKQVNDYCIRNELTARESQIVAKLLLRYTHREIAEQLEISPRTVERHVYNLYQKTGLSSRFELYDLIRVERCSD